MAVRPEAPAATVLDTGASAHLQIVRRSVTSTGTSVAPIRMSAPSAAGCASQFSAPAMC